MWSASVSVVHIAIFQKLLTGATRFRRISSLSRGGRGRRVRLVRRPHPGFEISQFCRPTSSGSGIPAGASTALVVEHGLDVARPDLFPQSLQKRCAGRMPAGDRRHASRNPPSTRRADGSLTSPGRLFSRMSVFHPSPEAGRRPRSRRCPPGDDRRTGPSFFSVPPDRPPAPGSAIREIRRSPQKSGCGAPGRRTANPSHLDEDRLACESPPQMAATPVPPPRRISS